MSTSQDEEQARRDEAKAGQTGTVEPNTLSQDDDMTKRKRFLMRESGTPEDEDQSEL